VTGKFVILTGVFLSLFFSPFPFSPSKGAGPETENRARAGNCRRFCGTGANSFPLLFLPPFFFLFSARDVVKRRCGKCEVAREARARSPSFPPFFPFFSFPPTRVRCCLNESNGKGPALAFFPPPLLYLMALGKQKQKEIARESDMSSANLFLPPLLLSFLLLPPLFFFFPRKAHSEALRCPGGRGHTTFSHFPFLPFFFLRVGET